ncbi:sorting nexin-24-like [Sycon ciliatum]|uniref:sorting nexin-24-like n=1 Tax=Sycon ciliatum TaxID=27933 RepID=UPI0020AB1A35|eukprot:scpid76529/ scgid9918/ Sorting nexin-24 &gt; Sorting nexin-24
MPGVEVTIPETRNSNADYTIYVLRVSHLKGTKLSEVRYSQFFELHKKLRKIIKPYPEFPARRLVRKLDPKVVEARRQCLEGYIQALVAHEPIHQLVLTFLGVPEGGYDGPDASTNSTDSMHAPHSAALSVNWEEVNKAALARVQDDVIHKVLCENADGKLDTAALQDNALIGMLTAMYN